MEGLEATTCGQKGRRRPAGPARAPAATPARALRGIGSYGLTCTCLLPPFPSPTSPKHSSLPPPPPPVSPPTLRWRSTVSPICSSWACLRRTWRRDGGRGQGAWMGGHGWGAWTEGHGWGPRAGAAGRRRGALSQRAMRSSKESRGSPQWSPLPKPAGSCCWRRPSALSPLPLAPARQRARRPASCKRLAPSTPPSPGTPKTQAPPRQPQKAATLSLARYMRPPSSFSTKFAPGQDAWPASTASRSRRILKAVTRSG
jgi:hypothetical protein